MNFKTKALVAAIALTAAGAANAAMTSFNDAGPGSILLSVWDKTNQVSALFDLGIDTDSFTTASATGNMSWDLTGGDYAAAWNSFSATMDLGNTVFMVFGGDRTGAAITDQYFVSTATNASAVNSQTPAQLSLFADVETYVTNSNPLGNHQTVADGANIDAGNASYQGFKMGDSWGNKASFVATTNIGDSMSFFALQGAGSGRNQSVVVTEFAGAFSLGTDGQLAYVAAPVPEPESYALMLAGLGLIGAVARRRSAR